MTDSGHPFKFSVDLAVVESLGINLYSNAAAVLSELVANAWDADANEVRVTWNETGDEIIIEDDGTGMTRGELNSRYLLVAYKKRDTEGSRSPVHDRPFMGRKGIGKLSVFSLAGDVTVLSAKDGEKNGFRIRVSDLKDRIARKEAYHPVVVPVPDDFPTRGTRIILNDLNRKRTGVSVTALRRRIARRFDVLGYRPGDPARFTILVEGKPVTFDDREDLKRLEYIWELGTSELNSQQTPSVKRRWVMADNVVDPAQDWKIEGWFGTVRTPQDLNDSQDARESLRNIIILARKRPIQEGILDQLDFNKIFGNYVTGQIRAEFLDIDGTDDIATSDRQRLIEDDARVKLLIKRLREMFNEAAQQWSDERPKQKFKELTDKYPAIQEWVDSRPGHQRDAARKVIGTVAALQLTNESQRPALYRSSVLAFERLALESTLDDLEQFASGISAEELLPILATAKTYEDALYVQILRSRLDAIEKFEDLMTTDDLEKVLQNHLFENMWLLDPSWEGATGDVEMERSLRRIRRESGLFDVNEEIEQRQGRIDIRYRSAAGVHMIVELKRYGRTVSLAELKEQGEKYHEALSEVLRRQNEPTRNINVVFVIGPEPTISYLGDRNADDYIADQLGHIGGRILHYDNLLATAERRYKEYRDRSQDSTRLSELLRVLDGQLGTESPTSDGGNSDHGAGIDEPSAAMTD